jgi:hypothetical protein
VLRISGSLRHSAGRCDRDRRWRQTTEFCTREIQPLAPAGLLSAEHREGAVLGEDQRDPLEASWDTVDEPLAVATGDLAVTPFVDGPGK